MQKEIDRFNRAFIGMAADYVESLEAKVKGNATYRTEPQAIFRLGTSLADEVRVANVLAVSIRRMQDAQGGELPVWEPDAAEPEAPQDGAEPVKLGPGVTFRLGKTPVSAPCDMPEGTEMTLEDLIRKIVAEMFAEWGKVNAACCINISREEAAEIERAMKDAGPGEIQTIGESEYSIAPLYAPLYAPGRILIVPKSGNGIALDSIKEAEDFIDHIQKMMAKVWCYNK